MRMTGLLWEQPVVEAARAWWARTGDGTDLLQAFCDSVVWARRFDDPPRLAVADTGATGRWVLAWSSAQRMAAYLGTAAKYVRAPGDALLDLLDGMDVLGIVLDPGETHWIALPTPQDWQGAPALTAALQGDQHARGA